MKTARNGTLRPEPAAAPKAPAPTMIPITREQLAGIQSREEQLALAQQQAKLAQINLNNFTDGIITGHGHNNVLITEYDDEALTLSFVPMPAPPKAEAKG